MKVVELLKLEQRTIEILQKSCIRVDYVRFIPMYEDYLTMAGEYKVSYIAACLSERYGISERQFYYLIKRLDSDCNLLAV